MRVGGILRGPGSVPQLSTADDVVGAGDGGGGVSAVASGGAAAGIVSAGINREW